MKKLKSIVTDLNDTSQSILSLLISDQPSIDELKDYFEQRSDSIEQLGFIKQEAGENTFNEEVGALEKELGMFKTLSEEINHRIFELRDNQQEKLARVKKQKKVSDSYKVSKTPNISYFK